MKLFSLTLLLLLLGTVSNFMASPCHAQTASDSNIDTSDNVSSQKVSANNKLDAQSPVDKAENSADNKVNVISENTEQASSVNVNQANQVNFRIPISSRIFAVPSMRQ